MIRRVFYLMILVAFLLSGCGSEVVTVNNPAALPQSPVQQDAPTRAVPSGGGFYSGDDIYDPAVESSELNSPADTAGIGEIQPVISGQTQRRMTGNYSGDDPYDPAAGGLSR
jgi:hypothetical protein